MKKSKLLALLLAMLMLAGISSACNGGGTQSSTSPAATDSEDESEDTSGTEGGETPTETAKTHLEIVTTALAVSMDPSGINDSASAQINRQMYECLVVLDYDTFAPKPALALSWDMPDPQTVTFQLREGVVFHNGEPFTAEDVKYSLEKAGASSHFTAVLGMIESVTVNDEYNVTVHLSIPFAPILRHLAHPGAAIAPAGMSAEELAENPIGTGPFMFSELVLGDRVEFVRNDDYWGNLPLLESLTFRVVPDSSGRLLAVETGEADIALELLPPDLIPAQSYPNVNLIRRMNLSTNYVGFNAEKEPFDNPLVRQAINYAIPTQQIVDVVFMGVGAPAHGPIANIVFGFAEIEPFDYDVEKAKELMIEAGYEDGFTTTIWYNVPNQTRMDIAEIVQHALREINIDVSVDGLEWGDYLTRTEEGEHDMFILGWVSVTGDADYGLYPLFHSENFGGAGNRTFYSNPEVDRLLELGRSEIIEEKRLEVYRDVQQIIRDEAPWIFINQGETLVAVASNLNGFAINPAGHHDYYGVWFS